MDIKINADGTFDLSTGDISLLKEDGYIGQTIYSYLMEIQTDQFAQRVRSSSNDAIVLYVKHYLERCLANDPVIDTNLLDISVESAVGSSIAISASYDGTSLTETDGYTTPKFSLIAGAAPLVDRNPAWLNYTNFDTTVQYQINYNVTLDTQSNLVEIPVLPICAQENIVLDNTFQCSQISITNSALIGVGTYRTETFDINVVSGFIVYPLSKHLSTSLRQGAEVISAAVINSSGAVSNASVDTKDGELCLFAKGEGVVNLTVTILPVGLITNKVMIDSDKEKEKVLYPLKPIRGKICAVFPKTLRPASYVITYTTYKQRSIW